MGYPMRAPREGGWHGRAIGVDRRSSVAPALGGSVTGGRLPCNAAPDCLAIRMLRESWTWFVRLDAPGHAVCDIRFNLVGSKAAIDQACALAPP